MLRWSEGSYISFPDHGREESGRGHGRHTTGGAERECEQARGSGFTAMRPVDPRT